jgi:hypothetical protein
MKNNKILQIAIRAGTKSDYCRKHLQLVNSVARTFETMSEKEIEMLSAFLSLDKKLTEEDMFNSFARKKVMEELGLSHGSLSNYIKGLIDKKVLNKHPITKKITIAPDSIEPNERGQGYQIKIELDETGE